MAKKDVDSTAPNKSSSTASSKSRNSKQPKQREQSKETVTKREMKIFKEALSYRTAKPITEYWTYTDSLYGESTYGKCPTCNCVIDRYYQRHCAECGQRLK